MKICLLLSGLPRQVERGYLNMVETILAPNNPDVFIHTWSDPETNGSLNNSILNWFKPKKFIMEKQKTFINSFMNLDRMMVSHGRSYQREKFVEMLYSSWYSVQQANLLKEQYRLENNITYDYVIRARFDISYNIKVDCKQYNRDLLHITNRGLPPEMIDDRFAFGNNIIMNTYCSGFNFLDYIHDLRDKQDGIFCGETLVYEMCKIFNITHKPISNLDGAFLR